MKNKYINYYRYINFIELELKPKVFFVENKEHNVLGYIKWHTPRRSYIFIDIASGDFFDAGCLEDIQDLINKLKT